MDEQRRLVLKGLAVAGLATVAVPREADAGNGKGPRWGMLVDLRKCIGCQACTVACSVENQVPLGHFRTLVSVYEVEHHGRARRFILPRLCNHCAKPACVSVCPTQATTKRPDGAVVVDNTVCIGCGYCVQACPYDARFINPSSGTADKCTFCLHRLEAGMLPACVETCVAEARVFGDLSDSRSMISRMLHRHPVNVLKKAEGTGPQVFYIGLDQAFADRVRGEQVLFPAGHGVAKEEVA